MDFPVFLINLDGSEARLRAATAALDAAGISFERVAAFDGRRLARAEFPDYDPRAALAYMGRELRGGEIGCYLSHLDCARRFLRSGAPLGMVLEDDMSPVPGFAPALEALTRWLSDWGEDWHLVNLGANKHKIYTPLASFDGHVLTRAHYFPMTTTGLIWSRAGARAFVEAHRRIACPVDNHFRHWLTRSDAGLAVWPPLVTTTGAESEIDTQALAKRSAEGRARFYGLIKQRRLMTDKLLALGHKLRARRR